MNSSLQKGNKAFMAASFVINSVLDTLDDEARSYLHVAKSQAEAARDEALITTSKFAFRNRDARRYEKLAKRYLVVAHELSARRQHRQPIAVEDYDDDDCLSVYSLEDDNDFSRPPVPSRSPSPYPPPPPYQTRQASPPTFSRPSSPQSTGSVGSSSSYATSHAAPPTYGYTTHPHHYPHAGQPGLVRAKTAASAPPPASAHGVPAQYQYAYQASYAGSYVVPMPAAGVAAVYPQYAYYPVIVPARQMA